jgi:hypothetical protein
MSNSGFGGLKKTRSNKTAEDPKKEEEIVNKAEDAPPPPITPVEPTPPPAPVAAAPVKGKDMVVPLLPGDHERLKRAAEKLSEEGYARVSMRQLAARLIKDGLNQFDTD